VVINMVEAFGPSVKSVLFDLNNLFAESAPEPGLAVSSYATFFELTLNDVALELMTACQMLPECFAAVANFATCLGLFVAFLAIASPDLKEKMLAILVSLPVILASEPLVAALESAPVRFLMPLQVFPVL
jgi:hypothetical protein